MSKQRLREVKTPAQGHTDQGLKPQQLTTNPKLRSTSQHSPFKPQTGNQLPPVRGETPRKRAGSFSGVIFSKPAISDAPWAHSVQRTAEGVCFPMGSASSISRSLMVSAGRPKKILRVRLGLPVFPLPMLIIAHSQDFMCPWQQLPDNRARQVLLGVRRRALGLCLAQPPEALLWTSASFRPPGGQPVSTSVSALSLSLCLSLSCLSITSSVVKSLPTVWDI